MGHVDFDKFRNRYTWHILETDSYICHYEQSNNNDDLISVLKAADNRLLEISKILDINLNCIKANEKRPKFNYWIHNSDIVTKSDIMIADGKSFGTGSASRSGIDYVVYNCTLREHLNHLIHEETHLIWMSEVGEAPSILNEGIAVYVEALVGDGYNTMKERFCNTWVRVIGEKKGLLHDLTNNMFFWCNYGKMPVYTLGGALVFFLIDNRGINFVKEIFANSHFHDPELVKVIENKTSMVIDTLESIITKWAHGFLK